MAEEENIGQRLQAMSTLLSRVALSSQLGMGYGGNRDIYNALGYKTDLTYTDYATQWKRQDIAKAVINRPVNATWRGGVTLVESSEDEETALEKDFNAIFARLKLHSKFSRLDKLACLGKYGILLLGLSDVQKEEDFTNEVQGTNNDLLYVKPFGEGSVQISEYERDPSNERFGLPTIYTVTTKSPGTQTTKTLRIHHSRVIHVPYNLMESEVEGTPQLEGVFNRLKDLEKIVGGSAEMFWRGARPGYQGKLDKDFHMGEAEKESLKDQIAEFEHNLRRVIVNEGVDLESLAQQVADPSNHVDVQLQMISAETGIPKRILVGSERGELASTEDKSQWNTVIQSRREETAEPYILQPFVEAGIQYGFLSAPKQQDEYAFEWKDLFAPSEKEQADIGKIRADALAAYAKEPNTSTIMPEELFFQWFLGLTDEQVEQINTLREQEMVDEQNEIDIDDNSDDLEE